MMENVIMFLLSKHNQVKNFMNIHQQLFEQSYLMLELPRISISGKWKNDPGHMSISGLVPKSNRFVPSPHLIHPPSLWFAAFFLGALSRYRTDLKTGAGATIDWCSNGQEIFQNLGKWVQSLCPPLWPFRSEMKENFYHSILPHVL